MSTAPPWRLRSQDGTRHWLPEGFAPDWPVGRLLYLAVDERLENVLTLAVNSWPTVDEHGRLRFDGSTREAYFRGAVLAAFLSEVRAMPPDSSLDETVPPDIFRSRSIRVGDVFAARARTSLDRATADAAPGTPMFTDPARWLDPPVYDLSGQARSAVKLAFVAAAAKVLPAETVRREFAGSLTPDPYDMLAEPQVVPETRPQ